MAVSEIDKHRRRWEENPKGLTFAPYADALRKAGEAEQALDVLRAGLEFHPDYIPANIVLGRCHLDLGDDAGAERAFERVLALDPENVIALKALADVNERAGRWSSAERWLDMLLSIDRGNDAAREQMGRVQMGAVQAAEAAASADVLAAAVASEPDVAMATSETTPTPASEQEAAIELDPMTTGLEVDYSSSVADLDVVPAFEAFQPESVAPDETTIVAPIMEADEIVLEDVHVSTSEMPVSSERAANEFAVEDAAASLTAAADDEAPGWAAVGTGEYVPSIFADESTPTPSESAVIEPMGGLELERVEEPTFAASDAVPELIASAYSDATTIEDTAAIEGFAPTTEFDAVAEAESAPVASALEPVVEADVEPAISLDETEISGLAEAADLAQASEPATEPEPVAVPSPVAMLALEPTDVAALDAAAREAAIEAIIARSSVPPADVLATAPAPDPAVLAALTVTANAALAMDVDAADAPIWDAWVWGEADPDLEQLHMDEAPAVQLATEPVPAESVEPTPLPIEPVPADDAEFAEAVLPFDDLVAADAAPVVVDEPAAAVPEALEAVGDGAAIAEAPGEAESQDVEPAADDVDAVPPGFAAPVLVTAAMAALYEGQGHLLEALATYRELESRTPGTHGDKIASLEARVRVVTLPQPPVFAARLSGGQPVHEFFGALLRTTPTALAPAAPSADDDGLALRRAAEPMSLGRLFGEESAASARPQAVAARTASIDEFYGAAAPAADAGGRDDLEQFHSWLQGLKT